jgi:hypothetical protein
MLRTIGDLHLTGEMERLRHSIPEGSRGVLDAAQAFLLSEVKKPKDAIDLLLTCAMRLLKALPAEELHLDHPAIGALATLLQHPQADRGFFELLPAELRSRVEQLVSARGGEWSPSQLEWQWVQFVGAFESTPLHPRLPLPQQQFEPRSLQMAWDALMTLATLRAWGLVT